MGDTKIESPEVYLVTPSRPSRRHVFLHGIMSNMPKIPPDIAKKPVSDSRALIQAFPANNAAAGLPVPKKIVNSLISAIVVEGGAIHITFDNRANSAIKGKVLTLRPAVVRDAAR